MGILDSLGVEGAVPGVSMSGVLLWGSVIFAFFIILIAVGAITFFLVYKKSRKVAFKNQIPIFQSINGKRHRIGMDQAKELFVPDTNISLFFLKSHKIYLARPTKAMGKDEYWYSIADNGEWVNFDLSTNPDQDTLANTNYDHRDTRYAYINLKEIIKKNYKDKSLVWWKDPVVMNIISFMIMSIIFIGGCWFVVAKIGGLVETLNQTINYLNPIADKIAGAVTNAQSINSGAVPT